MISQVTVGNLCRGREEVRSEPVLRQCLHQQAMAHWPSHVVVAPVTTAKQACSDPNCQLPTTMLAMACAACCLGPILVPQGDSCMDGSYPML